MSHINNSQLGKSGVSYYELLEVKEDASKEELREAYLKKVRENPPEEKPELFQEVRKAYEVLKDSEKKKEYDHILRGHDEKIKEVFSKVNNLVFEGELEKALKFLRANQESDPDILEYYFNGAKIAQTMGKEKMVQEEIHKLKERMDGEDSSNLIRLANLFHDLERSGEAIETLRQAEERATENQKKSIYMLLIDIYMGMRDWEKVLEYSQKLVPPIEEQTMEDLYIITIWINALFNLKRWSEKPQIKKRLNKLIQSIHRKEEEKLAYYLLKKEYDGFYEAGRFQEAEFYLEYLYMLRKDPRLLKEKKKIQELVKIEKDHDRLIEDEYIFLLVKVKAHELFITDYLPFIDPGEFTSGVDLSRYKNRDEDYAAGIYRLKKRYKAFYREYQEVWDKLYQEKTKALNREARRRIR